MRREERHHLKENPLATGLTQFQAVLDRHTRTIAAAVVLVLAGALGGGGYFWWQQQRLDRAGALLADALLVLDSEVASPDAGTAAAAGGTDGAFASEEAKLEAAVERLLSVAGAYPGLRPGITARYEAAVALVELGRPEEAAEHYQQVIDAAAGHLHGTMARLGLAETHVLRGDYDGAVELLRRETEAEASDLPVDAVLMRLGRAYELAGQDADALATFTRVVEEFPFSVYSSEARRKTDALGG